MIERGARRGLSLAPKAHPHTLPHACGYALANKGHDTQTIEGGVGDRSITNPPRGNVCAECLFLTPRMWMTPPSRLS
jgi:hypothetical protein